MKKYDLIHTDNYLLAVDDAKNHPIDVKYRWIFVDGVIQRITSIQPMNGVDLIIAHRPLNKAPFLEGVDVLPLLEQEDDAEKLYPINRTGSMWMPSRHEVSNIYRQEGYNKAKEKYRFTEEDVRKAIAMGYDYCHQKQMPTDWMIDDFIKSLSQPKNMPVAFECEYNEINWGGVVEGRKKTFINPEGRTEWVGKYIY